MIASNNKKYSIITEYLLIVVVLSFVTSCTAKHNQELSTITPNMFGLMSAPLPHYKVGTKFVYSNGTWETVTKVGPDGITWKNHRGNESMGLSDFTYKRHTWQTKDRRGNRKYNQTKFWFEKMTTSIWPLQVGNKTRFDEYGSWTDSSGMNRSYDSYWSCEVEGTERVSVVAGEFDTWKITCKRYPNSYRSTSKTREFRTWYYAPSVNHWVLEVRDYNGYRENRRKELAAILPDLRTFIEKDDDVVSLKKQFQNTLEVSQKGIPNIWENQREQMFVSMTPKKLFRLENGDVCRQYRQIIGDAGFTYEYPGIACRNDNGRWVVPRR